MDTYEENENIQEPEPQETPEEIPEKTSKDISEKTVVEISPELDTPKPTRPEKKKLFPILAAAVICIITLIAVAATFTITLKYINIRLATQNKQQAQLIGQLNQNIEELQQQLDKNTGSGNNNPGTDGVVIGNTPAQVYAQTVQGVVFITNTISSSHSGQVTELSATGSGFIISEDGYIVTNHHVVENATSLTVTLYDDKEYPATLIGSDSSNDIAVIKIEAEGLHALKFGSSDDLIVGDQVVVIGNPLGELSYSLTSGYVSAKDRVISSSGSLINMLQIDAAVNSGNSGGPVFNMNGQVVGIVTAKYSGTSSSGATIEGIGFAVPVDDVIRKISDLVEHGYITGAQLGVTVHDVDRETAEYYNLPLGVYVRTVVSGSCAEAAGIRPKDIIIGLGDYKIACLNDLSAALLEFKGGDATTITVWRSGKEIRLDIVLDAKQPT